MVAHQVFRALILFLALLCCHLGPLSIVNDIENHQEHKQAAEKE